MQAKHFCRLSLIVPLSAMLLLFLTELNALRFFLLACLLVVYGIIAVLFMSHRVLLKEGIIMLGGLLLIAFAGGLGGGQNDVLRLNVLSHYFQLMILFHTVI